MYARIQDKYMYIQVQSGKRVTQTLDSFKFSSLPI